MTRLRGKKPTKMRHGGQIAQSLECQAGGLGPCIGGTGEPRRDCEQEDRVSSGTMWETKGGERMEVGKLGTGSNEEDEA